MRLYLFEHCSVCFRVRMAAALKRSHLQETVVLEDDSETMIRLVGKRRVPILVKDDGTPMLESMDMVAHIESLGAPSLIGPERPEIDAWADVFADKTPPLTWPRYPCLTCRNLQPWPRAITSLCANADTSPTLSNCGLRPA